MQDPSQRTVTAFFRNQSDAEEAASKLQSAGIAKSDIHLVAGKEPDSVAATDINERGGFWASLADFFFPADDREVYAEGLRRGGYLVTVGNLDDARHKTALDILDDEGTIDVDEWADSWRAEGWTPSNLGYETDQSANAARIRQAEDINEDAFDTGRTTASDGVTGARDPAVTGSRVRSYVYDQPEKASLGMPPGA